MGQQEDNNPTFPPMENPVAAQPETPVVSAEVTPVPDTVVSPPSSGKKFSPVMIGMGVVLVILLLLVGFLVYQNSRLQGEMDNLRTANAEMESKKMAPVEPTATADSTADWETYTSENILFMYPSNMTVDLKGEDDDYIALLSDSGDSTSSVLEIDLSLSEFLADFSEAQTFWEGRLENVQMSEFDGGVKLAGEGTGESEGEMFTVALLKHGEGAISLVTMKTDNESLQLFDQILSTFEFTK